MERDLASLTVPRSGQLVPTGDQYEPYQLIGPGGTVVEAAAGFFRDLLAAGRAESTVRSYGMDLLCWFRFLDAAGVSWDRATRAEARDFSRWLRAGGKQPRRPGTRGTLAGWPAGGPYAPSVRAHSKTVLRAFYDVHRDAGTGPAINPFPLDRSRRGGRSHAHHNPMDLYRGERSGLYRPRLPSRIPRSVPDEEFNEIFARLPSHRDRALVAFYVSTGARASELLSATLAGTDPGRQVITVVRKGTRELQELPASPDAFVWLRLYQVEMAGLIPKGRRQPLWWTLRRPVRPLTYHAVHRMFERVNRKAGTAATLQSLWHTAAYRMAEDPALPLTDVQFVLGHARFTTTQIYLTQGGCDPPDPRTPYGAGSAGGGAGQASPGARLPPRHAGCAIRETGAVTTGLAVDAAVPAPPTKREVLRTMFPPRLVPDAWPATSAGREDVLGRLASPPFALGTAGSQKQRVTGLRLLLDWLGDQPGRNWQQRWLASGAHAAGNRWRQIPAGWLRSHGQYSGGRLDTLCGALREYP